MEMPPGNSEQPAGNAAGRDRAEAGPAKLIGLPELGGLLVARWESLRKVFPPRGWTASAIPPWKQPRRWLSVACAYWLIWLGLAVILDKLDPLGFSAATERYSEEVVARLAAAWHPQTAQKQVAVILIDEVTLQERGLSWPPPYDYYDELIRRLVRIEPAAVFLDLLMVHRRPQDESYEAARQGIARTLQSGRVPLYLAQSRIDQPPLFADVAPAASAVQVGWQGTGGGYPMRLLPHQRFGSAAAAEGTAACAPPEAPRSAAYALYADACKSDGRFCGPARQAGAAESFCQPMTVQWGQPLRSEDLELARFDPGECRLVDAGIADRLGHTAGVLLQFLTFGLYDDLDEKQRERCPFILSVKEEDLSRPAVREALKGRLLLVGLHIPGAGDQVVSPVHGGLPGVFLHAMALDNLLNWGDRYYRPIDSQYLGLLSLLLLGFLMALCAAGVFLSGIRYPWLCSLLAGLVIIGVSMFFAFGVLHRTPPDFIGLLLIYALVSEMNDRRAEPPEGGTT